MVNEDIKPNSERSEVERQERPEWRYVETTHGANVVAGPFILGPHWSGTVSSEEIRTTMRQIVSEHNQHTRLVEALKEAIAAHLAMADQLDLWAHESREGGWSTHQVEPMLRLADALRRKVARLNTALNPKG